MRVRRRATATTAVALVMLFGHDLFAQDGGSESAADGDVPRPQAPTRTSTATPWMLMYDGILFVNLNHQGGPRGGTEVVAPNWFMGMATRDTGAGRLTFDAMVSADPASVGER